MRYVLVWVLTAFILGSCTVNKDILFKAPKDYEYAELPDTSTVAAKLTVNNQISMDFYTGDGHMLIEMGIGTTVLSTGGGGGNQMMGRRGMGSMMTYLIDLDGTAKLPVLGRVELAGLNIREAEEKLEDLYSQYYNEPFVLLRVNNNRVIVSPGSGGSAQVITLVNNNTTLLEALAMAGGIVERGIASRIKLIRMNEETGKREVFNMDLSTIEGLDHADFVVQPNDIIYVEPLPLIAREVLREITPVVSLLSTAVLIITLANNL